LKGKLQDVEKPILHTRQFLDIGDCSSLSEVYTENIEKKMLGRSQAYDKINVEGEMNKKIALDEAKCTEDQASEVTCRRAKVSIRARSDFSLVSISISFCNYCVIIWLLYRTWKFYIRKKYSTRNNMILNFDS